jgi:Phage tail tube protein, GTA-gp10
MANPVKGEVSFECEGKKYTLVLGTFALAALERRLQMSWPQIIKRLTDGQAGSSEVLAMVYCGLLRHHRQITEEQVADLIDELGQARSAEILAEALKLMFPGREADEPIADGGPPKPGNGHGTTYNQIGS